MMSTSIFAVGAAVVALVLFFASASPAMAQLGDFYMPREDTTTFLPPKNTILSDPPISPQMQAFGSDPEVIELSNRITAAVMGNTIMLKTITNVVEGCMSQLYTMDKEGFAVCADFVEAQNKAFSTFLKENQNLTNRILYGG
ncbi:MAG: hypothetical protein ACRD47_14295 [Nitrososphaeraceae archaeon]